MPQSLAPVKAKPWRARLTAACGRKCGPGRPQRPTALTRRQEGDTSPLGGLAHATAAFAYANVLVPSGFGRFRALRFAARFAYANLLIPWVGTSFARFLKP